MNFKCFNEKYFDNVNLSPAGSERNVRENSWAVC